MMLPCGTTLLAALPCRRSRFPASRALPRPNRGMRCGSDGQRCSSTASVGTSKGIAAAAARADHACIQRKLWPGRFPCRSCNARVHNSEQELDQDTREL